MKQNIAQIFFRSKTFTYNIQQCSQEYVTKKKIAKMNYIFMIK